jgi:hypothetical protein
MRLTPPISIQDRHSFPHIFLSAITSNNAAKIWFAFYASFSMMRTFLILSLRYLLLAKRCP